MNTERLSCIDSGLSRLSGPVSTKITNSHSLSPGSMHYSQKKDSNVNLPVQKCSSSCLCTHWWTKGYKLLGNIIKQLEGQKFAETKVKKKSKYWTHIWLTARFLFLQVLKQSLQLSMSNINVLFFLLLSVISVILQKCLKVLSHPAVCYLLCWSF